MEGFQPPEPYIRELKRYKVLADDFDPASPLDYYAADRAYWASFEAPKALEHSAYTAGLTAIPSPSP